MANQKPSDRRRGGIGEGPGEPDLTPIMNLTFMLILALLTLSSVVPLGLITVQAPQIGGGGPGPDDVEDPEDKKPKLNLTIFVTRKGFNLAASGATLDGSSDQPPRPGEPLFPKIKDDKGVEVYDFQALHRKLIDIKKSFDREQSVIITADEDVIYEDIVKTMDAARETGDGRELFPAVAFSAGIVG